MTHQSSPSQQSTHLRDYQMPTWQIIGLLRAALLQHEAVYFDSGRDAED